MRNDADIARDVEAELQWDPGIDDTRLDVAVRDGIVTLSGEVAHCAGRQAAETITRRVRGVRAIVCEISVNIPTAEIRGDTDIASAALRALRSHLATSGAAITPTVHDGCVALSGRVTWGFQRSSAEQTIRLLPGVRGVRNDIVVVAQVTIADIKRHIEAAL